ncbi:MAG: hypothetical protein GYB66_08050, partial [Chloroflexi bacterium]|nr:hypothetical protein [Chloroflexota bacterium]
MLSSRTRKNTLSIQVTLSVLFFTIMVALTTFLGKAITLGLLIDNVDLALLPVVLVGEAASWGIIANFRWYRAPNQPSNVVITTSVLPTVAVTLASVLLVENGFRLGYVLLYLAYRLFTQVLTHHGISFAAPIFQATHRREQLSQVMLIKRAIDVALALAMIPLALWLSWQGIINIWIASIFLMVIALAWLAQFNTKDVQSETLSDLLEPIETDPRHARHWRTALQGGLLRWLVLGVLSAGFFTTLMLYQTAQIVGEYYTSFEDIFVFFAFVAAGGNAIMLLLEYHVSSSVLGHTPSRKLAGVYPGLLGLAFASGMLFPLPASGALMEFTRSTGYEGMFAPSTRLFSFALPDSQETWARRLLYFGIAPAGRLLAGLGLVLATLPGIRTPIWVLGSGLVSIALFTLATYRAATRYNQRIAGSVQNKEYRLLRCAASEGQLHNRPQTEQLIDYLRQPDLNVHERLLIAEVVARSEIEEGYIVLCEIWQQASPDLQTELLPLIVDGWPDKVTESNRPLVFEALESDFAPLRRQALQLAAKYPDIDPTYEVARFLIDPDPIVNVIAASNLLRHPAEHLRTAAQAQLRWLAKDNEVSTRTMAVNELVQGSLNSFGELQPWAKITVEHYLQDPAPRFREAVLPAATIPQLITMARDPAAKVRLAAAKQLRERRLQGSRKQLLAAMDQVNKQTLSNGVNQIEATLHYWRLLVALSRISTNTVKKRLVSDLDSGFEALIWLQEVWTTVDELRIATADTLLRQIEHDHDTLLQTMIEYLVSIVGERRANLLVWRLRTGERHAESQQAEEELQQFLSPRLAYQFREAITW